MSIEPTPDTEASTTRRAKPVDGGDASQTLQLGGGTVRISKQGIGITLQSGTLIALLSFGWQAKATLDEQLEQVEQQRIEFDARHVELEKAIHELDVKMQANAIGAATVVTLQAELMDVRMQLQEASRRLEDLERDRSRP